MFKLYDFYKKEIIFKLMKQFNYTSIMQVPKIIKITLNMGVGKSILNRKILDKALEDLMLISGQKPIFTKARKSIALFKIRQGDCIGCKVTLRNYRMWDFLERLIFIAIPRIRDFRGMSIKSFDSFGNYNFGIREHIIFPEIDFNTIDYIRGLDISISTSAKSDYECKILLASLNFPFSNNLG